MNDVSSEDPINCLVIVIGEYGHVMSWAYCNAEGSNLYQYLNQQLLKRCQMLDLHVDGIKPRSSLSHPNNPYQKNVLCLGSMQLSGRIVILIVRA